MNKQEVIKTLESIKVIGNDALAACYNERINVGIALIKRLGEPQKPVVPKFVADYIEEKKEDFVSLSGAIRTTTDSVNEWLFENPTVTMDEINLGIFVNAWNNGYKIDSPKKWVVIGKSGYLTSFSIGKNRACGWTGNGDKYNSGAIHFSDEKTALNIAEVVEGKIEEV